MKVLFFDIGYTLVNEDAVWKKRCEEQAEGIEAKRLGLSATDIYHEIEKATIAGLPQYRTVIDKFNLSEVAPYRCELETMYDEVPGVLKTLASKYKLGVIANQLEGLEQRLEQLGIRQYFSYIISSGELRILKPDIRIFKHALKVAGCKAQDAVMIGDRIDNDTKPAQTLGMKAVWIKRGFGKLQTSLATANPPDYEIENLTELLDITF